MFSKVITNSSGFLMMSQSAQNLYFHIGMNADDDGFCEIFSIMRMTESKPDDLKSIVERGFIYVIDSRVCIVKDWHENNYIQADRYTQSTYLKDPKFVELYGIVMKDKISNIQRYKAVNDSCIHNVSEMDTQVRLGKGRKGKERIQKEAPKVAGEPLVEKFTQEGAEVVKAFEIVDPKNKTYYKNITQRSAADFLISEYGKNKVLWVIQHLPILNKQQYMKKSYTPFQLKENWQAIKDHLESLKAKKVNSVAFN